MPAWQPAANSLQANAPANLLAHRIANRYLQPRKNELNFMFLLNLFRKNSPEDIYWENPERKNANVVNQFTINKVKEGLKVKNDEVNYLFSKLTKDQFINAYKDFHHKLNLNFDSFKYKSNQFELSDKEKNKLEQEIILWLIRYYELNSSQIKVKRHDFHWIQTLNKVRWLMIDKFDMNQEDLQLEFGAHIIRMKPKKYKRMIKSQEKFESYF